MKILIIFNRDPYDGSDITWNGLRLADKLREAGQSVRILRAHEIAPVLVGDGEAGETVCSGYPGMLTIGPEGELIVFCGLNGCELMALDVVHPAGKRQMPAADFARGRRISHGDRFGSGMC